MAVLRSYLCLALLVVAAPALAQEPRPVPLDTLRVDVASRAATLAAVTRSVEVLDADGIRRLPLRTVAEALGWMLGADLRARSPAQADIAVRGSTFEQVVVLVDGVRMNDPQTGHFALDLTVPLDEVERIEILRGPGSSLYGSDAMGGVIHIVTRRGASAAAGAGPGEMEASLDGGSFGTAGLSVATGVDGLRSRVAAEARRSDGHRPGADSRTILARASLDGDVAGGPLRADMGVALRDFGARGFYTAPDAPFDEYERTRTATASVGWRSPAAAGWSVEPRLSVRRHTDEFLLMREDPDFYRNVHRSWQAGGDVVGRAAPAAGVALSLGAEAYRDLLESSNLGDPAETRAAAFGELALGRDGAAVVHLGLRGDHHSAYGAFAAPSLAVAFWPAPALLLRASAGRSFRAPNWTERYYIDPANEGDPELRPERAWNGEVAVEAGRSDAVASVGVAAFVRDARDLIDWARPAGGGDPVWRTMNVGRATFRGLEVDGRVVDPTGTRWAARAALLHVSARDEGWESKYALRPLTRTLSVSASRPVLGFEISGRVFHARRADEPSYMTLDGRLSRRVGDRLRVHLDLSNLSDARYLDVTGMPAPGRAAYIGVGWR